MNENIINLSEYKKNKENLKIKKQIAMYDQGFECPEEIVRRAKPQEIESMNHTFNIIESLYHFYTSKLYKSALYKKI